MSIALIDYQAGNLTSVRKGLAAVGADVVVPAAPADLESVSGIIVPGVGHFGATEALRGAWLRAIGAAVEHGVPLLGICLGMQWLYEGSDEAPDVPGLGVLAGRCYRLGTRGGAATVKVPHVGWNSLSIVRRAPILEGVEDDAQVYFTHSYVGPITADTVAVTDHGEPFTSAVQRGRIAGVQFHPEKSGEVGLSILRNWLAATRSPAFVTQGS